jgi:hypothetical protein
MTPTLTPLQRAALKTAIQADPVANGLFVAGNLEGLAMYLNTAAAPAFTVWKPMVTITQVGDNIVATELAGLSALNSTRLQTIVGLSQSGFNPTLADRRAFFDDVFSGAGGALTRAKLAILWKRLASRCERVFTTGTGSDVSPGVIVSEGPISSGELVGL